MSRQLQHPEKYLPYLSYVFGHHLIFYHTYPKMEQVNLYIS